ncbi:MAG: GntR family transcriptional regulator [Candidatus Rokubacteria bacterium]|nr:GntR family transcriptional regulator [Candidatus Rokubacteria bacterium]
MKLTAGGPIPLYYQLEQDLRERIGAGEFRGSAPLPTEQRLCEAYGVSRITVRRALDSLLASGLIARRQGVGTFVNEPGETVKSLKLIGSLDDITAYSAQLAYKVLARETVAATRLVAEALDLPARASVTRLETVFSLRGDPFAHAEFFCPPGIGDLIGDADIAGQASLVAVVERKLGRTIERADQTVEAAIADRRVARHLGLRPRAPVLEVNRTYYTDTDRPVVAVVVRYHPERYRYTVQLFANARAAHRSRA